MSILPSDHDFVIKILNESLETLLQPLFTELHLYTGRPHVELPLGEVDDPAVGDGLIALGTLAVVPEPDPGVLVHLAPDLLPHHLVLGPDLHHQPPPLIVQPHRAWSRGECARLTLKAKPEERIWFYSLLMIRYSVNNICTYKIILNLHIMFYFSANICLFLLSC